MQITIANRLIKKLQLDPHAIITVRAGMISMPCRLEVKRDLAKPFRLSSDLAQYLHVKSDRNMQIRYDKDANLLQLGPYIGILVNGLPNRSEYDPKSLQAELIYLSEIGAKMAAEIFVFTPSCIDWPSKTTRGYVYKRITEHSGIWAESRYPLPDVVYDRIPSRAIEARENIKSARRRLMSIDGLKYFNPSFLNKWRVYKLLSTNEELSSYLPETKLLTPVNLANMLNNHKVVFIKPSNGSQGKGIVKARKDKDTGLIHGLFGCQRIRRITAGNSIDFLSKIESITKNKSYIVQQGIDLIKYQNSAFDIRIIYQKNGQGTWAISKKFVRVAAPKSSITNLSSGGRSERSVVVLKQIFHNNKDLIAEKNQEMEKVCEMIANTLESNSESIFGELGLDIGIDKKGRLWLIEVNSKPRKTTQTEMSKIIVHNTFSRPLEYAVYLAGFKNDKI
ncbi:MAG: YheD [Firmicutes bacterium]|nr:YheD [Bacillota bacterium]